MIYDISEYSITKMIEDKRLISELMRVEPTLTSREVKDKIIFAYEKCDGFVKPEPVKSYDHQPCCNCGGSSFIRTGTCFVCDLCGSSQGCS